MENVFIQKMDHSKFTWGNLGNIRESRGELGEEMPVLVYRLMQFTLLDVLASEFGREKANHYIREAGFLAGTEFTKNIMDLTLPMEKFIASLQKALKDLKVGILRIESVSENASEIVLTVGEDLDCSGLPVTDETICNYDEGFIAGVLKTYTGKAYVLRTPAINPSS